jgi:hypothetical protein
MPKAVVNFKFLLVFVDIISNWAKADPTRMEKHSEVAWTLLKDIIPKYGISDSIQSDGGPDFVSEIMRQVSKALGSQWKSHTT